VIAALVEQRRQAEPGAGGRERIACDVAPAREPGAIPERGVRVHARELHELVGERVADVGTALDAEHHVGVATGAQRTEPARVRDPAVIRARVVDPSALDGRLDRERATRVLADGFLADPDDDRRRLRVREVRYQNNSESEGPHERPARLHAACSV
jgi:hypothetical protein